MKKILSGLAAGALAMGVFASSAFAAVSFDPTTGTGFVGKGDVQLALGLNNSQLQAKASALNFTYVSEDTYAVTETWITGEGTRGEQTHFVTLKRTETINDTVKYDARTHKQVDGFDLTGITQQTVEGSIPAVGQEFPGSSGHMVTDVEAVSSTSGLYVNGTPLPQ